jgi:hypothetical protein
MSEQEPLLTEMERMLAPLAETMRVDGYALDVVDAGDDRLRVGVRALDDACEDCLVPADVLRMMISGQVDGRFAPAAIDVTMPGEA